MKKNGIAELVFILDESGSMGPVRSDTIGGFNSTIAEHQGTEENIITSVILFSDEHRKLFDRVAIDEIPVITEADYKPHGCTALCDAVGDTISDIMSRQNAMPEEARPEISVNIPRLSAPCRPAMKRERDSRIRCRMFIQSISFQEYQQQTP